MPKYYGCPCEGCGKPLTLQDDIVVCPDCGAPYHRVCYEKLGQCIHRPAHAAGYEWKFPYEESQLRTCPSCGERTLRVVRSISTRAAPPVVPGVEVTERRTGGTEDAPAARGVLYEPFRRVRPSGALLWIHVLACSGRPITMPPPWIHSSAPLGRTRRGGS